MKRVLAAIAFLTRWPVRLQLDAADVGRATLVFPLVGAALGGLLGLWAELLAGRMPPLLSAALVLAASALLTGALHLDGLADMADGFGGGRTREDVLRIMRDHSIGAYGAVALGLALLVKVAALSTLIERHQSMVPLVLGCALARWASVPLGRFLPYARAEGGLGSAITDHVGLFELLGATAIAGGLAFGLDGLRGGIFWAGCSALSTFNGMWCRERIGGITGDTLGANTELCEALVWVMAVAVR
jgi:adenosylcobinamide-GDP ribazoletransferase